MMETTPIQGHCHCGRFKLNISIPSISLPLSSAFCNCSSCRHSTGQLAASFATIPVDPSTLDVPVFELSHSETSTHRIRYYCPQCGANVMDFDNSDSKWRVCTGILDKTEGLLKRDQIWLEDTLDGGLSLWLNDVGTRYKVGGGSEVVGQDHEIFKAASTSVSPLLPHDARLVGCCYCGEVEFEITAPSKGEKYPAGICTCTSCRLTAGFELTAWTSIPFDKVRMPGGAPLDFTKMKSLTKYTSSPGVHRCFCGQCGAAVFVAKDNQSWIDIAAGVLRAEEGARAENWLYWKAVGFPEEATDQNLTMALLEGMKLR